MGWAAGFQSGSAVAQRALDAYDQRIAVGVTGTPAGLNVRFSIR